MKKRLLIICGPTATGKTKLGIYLSKLFNGEIVSADSRQVYKGMNIGTGKDISKNFEFKISDLEFRDFEVGYYTNGKIRVWGYDLADPKKDFSVSYYIKIVRKILADIWKRNKLPVLVGGTGFYINAIVHGIETSDIPRSESLRKSLEGKTAQELFEILRVKNPLKSASLNISDRGNPRRLIRAIEIVESRLKHKIISHQLIDKDNLLIIGLKSNKDFLTEKIKRRVEERIKKGVEKELKDLLNNGVKWDMQSMNTLGYKEWKQYFDGKIGFADLINKWTLDEIHYAKRQLTWFKNEKEIKWFDISDSAYKSKVERLVGKWYHGEEI